MNVLTIGEGERFVNLSREIARKGEAVTAIGRSATVEDFRRTRVKLVPQVLAKCDIEKMEPPIRNTDVVFVVHEQEDAIREILDQLLPQVNGAAVYTVTSADTKQMAEAFPGVQFTSVSDLLSEEGNALYRHANTVSKVRAVRGICEGAKKLLILIYGNPDPDALASAWALRTLVKRNAENSTIAYTGEIGRVENLAMIQTLKLPVEKLDPGRAGEYDVVATVDGQPGFFPPEFPIPFDIVIDHHPKVKPVTARYVDIRPEVGATASILTGYLLDAHETINRRLASALLYALRTDTQNFQRALSDEDVTALRALSRKADQNTIRRIELSHFPIDTLDYFGIALVKRVVARDVVFAYLGHVKMADICVHVAELFIKVTNIAWSIVAGVFADTLVVVFRSDGWKADAGKVASKAFSDIGRAGGHRTMARAEIPLFSLRPECPNLSNEEVEYALLKRLAPHLRGLKRVLRDHREA